MAAGSAPPTTKPKKRGPAVATSPVSVAATSSSITVSGSAGEWFKGREKAVRRAAWSTGRATGRPGSERR
ncbi:hypothetical protein GCM10010104_35300 [Streptomyces indiaensis]|uniref:Uncharacterized protein n=1 Tax=Streptomyces indiaensis TaxID=284033 RepID=A0ABN3DNC3_9ACTN